MSKLDEVQELLDIMIYGSEHITAAMAYEKATTVLRELNKPVQYTVTLTKSGETNGLTGEAYVSAQINGVNLFYGVNPEVIRKAAIHQIQIHAKAMCLPPITIEQITFVEV